MAFDEGSWARDLLTRMDYPVNQANMTALIAWQYAEGGHFANAAKFNPLNTTKTWPGAESMNSVGVKAYDNYEEGMAATVATLKLPYYNDVRAALKDGNSSREVINAVVESPWGTTGLAFGTLGRAREFLKDHPNYLKPASPNPSPKPKPSPSKPRPRPPSGPSGAETVIVYPVELDGLMTHLTNRISTVKAADTAGRDVWADLNLSAVIDPTVSLGPGELPGVDRERLHQATRELGMSLDESLGLPFVDRQLGGSRLRVERFLARLAEIEANGYRPRTRAEAVRMLKALKGKLDPPGYAAMETFLLGGLRTGRPPGHRPSSPHRPPASKPKDPRPPTSAKEKRDKRVDEVLDRARLELQRKGPEEHGYNRTRYGAWYGMQAEWCAMFVSYVFAKSGHPLPAIQGPKGFAGVPYAIGVLRERGQLHSRPKVGDVFLREGRGHTGIVTAVHENADGSYSYSTIEGNAGANTDAVVTDKHNTKDSPKCHFWSPIK